MKRRWWATVTLRSDRRFSPSRVGIVCVLGTLYCRTSDFRHIHPSCQYSLRRSTGNLWRNIKSEGSAESHWETRRPTEPTVCERCSDRVGKIRETGLSACEYKPELDIWKDILDGNSPEGKKLVDQIFSKTVVDRFVSRNRRFWVSLMRSKNLQVFSYQRRQ